MRSIVFGMKIDFRQKQKTYCMKKVFFALIFSAIIFSASAQSFHLGAKVGANLGKVDGQSFKDGFNLGFHLGGYAQLDFNKFIGIQPEILFSNTQTKYDTSAGQIFDISNGKNISLNYLTIPVLLRIKATNLLTFNVGPQFGILMNNHETVLQNGKDAFKTGDFALVAGAQVNLGSINIYGRYNIGLSNINDVTSQSKWKNQQLQFGLGLRLL